jgi:hypothetical protein
VQASLQQHTGGVPAFNGVPRQQLDGLSTDEVLAATRRAASAAGAAGGEGRCRCEPNM